MIEAGSRVMAIRTAAASIVALCALGLALSACSLAGPAPRTFTPVESKPTKQETEAAALEAASKSCKASTRDRGIKSVLAIVSRMRPGAVDEDYIACMKKKGYEAAK